MAATAVPQCINQQWVLHHPHGITLCQLSVRVCRQVIQRANYNAYGLAAGVFSRNVDEINTLTRGLRSGTVWANCYNIYDVSGCTGGGIQPGRLGFRGWVSTLEICKTTREMYSLGLLLFVVGLGGGCACSADWHACGGCGCGGGGQMGVFSNSVIVRQLTNCSFIQ